jgi:hypothetical protein
MFAIDNNLFVIGHFFLAISINCNYFDSGTVVNKVIINILYDK